MTQVPRRLSPSGLLLVLGLVLASERAEANTFDTFGFDPRNISMGGAGVASANDYTATWFNPSLLVLRKDLMIGVGFSWAQPVLQVSPQVVGAKLNSPGTPDYGGISLGAVFPLAGKVHNRVAIGLGVYSPSNNLLRTEAIDPHEPAWYLYQSSPDRIVITAGLGIRITDNLLLGAGAQFLAGFVGDIDFKVDLFSKEFQRRNMRTDLETTVAPIVGLTVNVEQLGLRLGASFRRAIQLDYHLPTAIDLGDIGALSLDIKGIAHYAPHTITVGASYTWQDLTITADARYAMWSKAPNPAVSVAVDLHGDVVDSLGLANALNPRTEDLAPGFQDTLTPHIGAEYAVTERFLVRAGFFYRPTPVPIQNEDTNILDADTLGLAGGFGAYFDDPLEVFSKPLQIHLGFQRLILNDRTADKAKSNAVPSYTYGGHVNSLSIAIRNEF